MRRAMTVRVAVAVGLAAVLVAGALPQALRGDTRSGAPRPAAVQDGRPAPVPPLPPGSRSRFAEVRRFAAAEARQGVALDAAHFYAIDTHHIAKYDRRSGQRVAEWKGERGRPIVHLNSCIVGTRGLVCAHSNYPAVPMVSSIEIWDPATLQHRASHSFGIYEGSLTWAIPRGGEWWLNFAHYGTPGGVPGRGPEWASLVRTGEGWTRAAGYVYPRAFVDRLAPYSSSGGNWGTDGLLYVSGHHDPEIYVFRLPAMGSVLEWIETIPAPIEGQAWAFDPLDADVIWGIRRSSGEVVVARRVP